MAHIRILRPGDEAALEAYVLPRIESSMFLLSNMRAAGLQDNGGRLEGTYAAAFEGRKMVAVVAHYWNGNLILQAPVHLDALWRAASGASGRAVRGLLGPGDQVGAVRAALDLEQGAVQIDETENLYSLPLADMAVPEGLRLGWLHGRRAEPGDIGLLTEWRVGFSVEALDEQEGPELKQACRASVERAVAHGWIWMLEDRGRPVATSAFNAAVPEAVQIGGVWTPPELRSRGYGRAVVAQSLLDARAEGVGKAFLFTGVDNVAARKAYEALGFRHIGDYRLLLLRSWATTRSAQ